MPKVNLFAYVGARKYPIPHRVIKEMLISEDLLSSPSTVFARYTNSKRSQTGHSIPQNVSRLLG